MSVNEVIGCSYSTVSSLAYGHFCMNLKCSCGHIFRSRKSKCNPRDKPKLSSKDAGSMIQTRRFIGQAETGWNTRPRLKKTQNGSYASYQYWLS